MRDKVYYIDNQGRQCSGYLVNDDIDMGVDGDFPCRLILGEEHGVLPDDYEYDDVRLDYVQQIPVNLYFRSKSQLLKYVADRENRIDKYFAVGMTVYVVIGAEVHRGYIVKNRVGYDMGYTEFLVCLHSYKSELKVIRVSEERLFASDLEAMGYIENQVDFKAEVYSSSINSLEDLVKFMAESYRYFYRVRNAVDYIARFNVIKKYASEYGIDLSNNGYDDSSHYRLSQEFEKCVR